MPSHHRQAAGRRLLLAGVLLLATPAACQKAPAAGPSTTAHQSVKTGAAHPKAPPAAPAAGHRVYTWYDASGVPHLATSLAEIPPPARGHVVVSKLDAGGKDALDDSLTVGDFSTSAPQFSRVDLAHLKAPGDGAIDGKALLAHDDEVTIYGTSWCHFCKAARAFLEARHVPFVDVDIEADARAAAEMKAKLRAAGIRFGGVPVLDVRGRLIEGFDKKRLVEALDAAGYGTAPSPSAHG